MNVFQHPFLSPQTKHLWNLKTPKVMFYSQFLKVSNILVVQRVQDAGLLSNFLKGVLSENLCHNSGHQFKGCKTKAQTAGGLYWGTSGNL